MSISCCTSTTGSSPFLLTRFPVSGIVRLDGSRISVALSSRAFSNTRGFCVWLLRMAVMATEQPQTVPAEPKSTVIGTAEDKMVVDSAAPTSVNGHSTPVASDSAHKASATNGDASEPAEDAAKAHNAASFKANSDLSARTDKDAQDPQPTVNGAEDSDMPDVDGQASDKKDAPSTDAAVSKDSGLPKSPSSPKPRETAAAADSMDVDSSTDRADVATSAEHAESTQDTSAMSDVPLVESPREVPQDKTDDVKPTADTPKESEQSKVDVSMKDSSVSPGAKVAREREEDSADEPAAKRARTEEPTEITADSLTVATGTPGASHERTEPADDGETDAREITSFQNKQIRGIIAGIKKTKNGGNFRKSVRDLWPGLWNDYSQKVENPVDLSLFESKLRDNSYANYGELKQDVRLLYQNCVLFNGENHIVTNAAAIVRDQIFSKLPEISLLSEPVRAEKSKAQPSRLAESRAATQPRRQSQPQSRVATSPKPKADVASHATPSSATSTSAPAFAIPPNGVPQIRRDSTRDDGDRPKRPIHPPKNRDLDYAGKGARKKKLDPEQKFFAEVLAEIKKGKHFALNQWFMEPVDPVAFNIPTYFSIVKKPMDLRTMTERNEDGQYKTAKDVEKDMRQIITNSELFNGPDHDVTKIGKQLETLLKSELAKKDSWMAKNYPPEPANSHGNGSPDRSADESEDESEAEPEEEDNETIRNLQSRLKEEQDKLNTLIGSKRPDLSMIEIQQSMVSMIQRKLVEEKTKFHSEKKPTKKKGGASKSKAKASAGGSSNKKGAAGGAASKKAGAAKKAAPRKRSIGPLEKAIIAEGINELDGNTLTRAVEIIKRDTGQNVGF
ncbi:uncharacterized protein B0I36DRAFT_4901 [Microdochium trichocladiopsis]|uniref:Bromo domain-containing protein n=1 Tax=Microdochium trichocladiopsis TaxID=1682393 RepID=A0A9P9BVS8_9PEZI|nr:uncharacterized protein B0I36DRAFT_4901 [Microdochium trichocladiopsis]KAH7040062.1 hypothetical protein B0I36DRAFT_4901 [Microdochium trichocladiopsis]